MNRQLKPSLTSLLLASALFASVSCGTFSEPHDEESEGKFHTGAGPARGHEDITRFGAEAANAKLLKLIGKAPYPVTPEGTSAALSTDPLTLGNFQTDFPNAKMRAFYNVDDSVDWHKDQSLQHIHSLRGTENGVYRSNRKSCEKQVETIKAASAKGLELIRSGDRNEGLYWLGHATHVIQDSFSEAHTMRSDSDGRSIKEFCTYDAVIAGVCHHNKIDLRDRIWHSGISCTLNLSNRGWECLKGSARFAAQATGSYLVAMGQVAFGEQQDLDAVLDEYFAGTGSENGYFNCQEIPDDDLLLNSRSH